VPSTLGYQVQILFYVVEHAVQDIDGCSCLVDFIRIGTNKELVIFLLRYHVSDGRRPTYVGNDLLLAHSNSKKVHVRVCHVRVLAKDVIGSVLENFWSEAEAIQSTRVVRKGHSSIEPLTHKENNEASTISKLPNLTSCTTR